MLKSVDQMNIVHTVNAVYKMFEGLSVEPLYYKCSICSFTGPLKDAVTHSTRNQFVYKEDTEDDSFTQY